MAKIRKCEKCAKPLHPDDEKYCSNACRHAPGITPCRFCGEPKVKKSRCLSIKCTSSRRCIVCSEAIPPNWVYTRCHPCHNEYRRGYAGEYRAKSAPPKPSQKCMGCPSRNAFGRCGALTSGPHQMTQAVAVRILQLCPRQHGVRDCLDVVDVAVKIQRATAQKAAQRYTRHSGITAQLGRGSMKKRKSEKKSGAFLIGDWLTVSQYAKREGISRQAAYKRIKAEAVQAVLVGVWMVRS